MFSFAVCRVEQFILANAQSAESFLMAFKRFAAARGYPRNIYSDLFTNLSGARPVLQGLYKFVEDMYKSGLKENAAKNGTEWIWKIHPANSPHRNEAEEAAVHIVSRVKSNQPLKLQPISQTNGQSMPGSKPRKIVSST